MILSGLYLLDATATETNAVRLKFLRADGKIEEIIDDKYKPYFLTPYPSASEDVKIIKYFSGDVEPVEKTDLFIGERRTLGKVAWPNPRVASKAARRFRQLWESEIDFPKSYIYDKGLIFGTLHSENGLKPILGTPEKGKEKMPVKPM